MTTPSNPEWFPAPPNIAVVIPCYNEGLTIEQTVAEIRSVIPEACFYVFDNRSSDNTAEAARRAGATVIPVTRRGKGNVVRRMFADVDADVYVMVDGDATYGVSDLPAHIRQLLDDRLDMVVGCRKDDHSDAQTYRTGHRLGNRVLTGAVGLIFGKVFTDMLSGYRVFSRRFAKSYPGVAPGFEVETELTVHALELRMPTAEVEVQYRSRPEGSVSKLSTYKDGLKILRTITRLFMHERPLAFFSLVAAILGTTGLLLAAPVAQTYFQTGLVPRVPTLLLTLGILLCAVLSMLCGMVVNSVLVSRQEVKLLAYLSIPLFRNR